VEVDTAYTCNAVFGPSNLKFRYPGEECDKNEDCLNLIGEDSPTCVSGYCSGATEGKTCKLSANCVVGLYCDKTSNTCVKQKLEGDCTESSECVNHLLCHKGKCSLPPYSLDIGAEVDKEDYEFNRYKCKLSYVSNGKCASLVQEEAGDKDGFVECKYGEACKYKVGNDEEKKNCVCGYNADGKGYCPLGSNKREELLTKAYVNLASLFENTCHTDNRAYCYQKTSKTQGYAREIVNFEKAHLFHNAVPCADAVLSGNFLSFSTMAVVIFISLFF
jgi:hypothetical protein